MKSAIVFSLMIDSSGSALTGLESFASHLTFHFFPFAFENVAASFNQIWIERLID